MNQNLQALVSNVSNNENDPFLNEWWKWQEEMQKLQATDDAFQLQLSGKRYS